MNYGQIRHFDIANGPGIRASLFVTGCNFHCPGCFNEEYQDPEAGQVFDRAAMDELITAVQDPNIAGFTVLGGEPLQNCQGLLPVLQSIRQVLRPDQSIWIYSGYRYEQAMQDPEKSALLALCDVMVDGLFKEEEKDLKLHFRGSKNQRLIDLKASSPDQVRLMEI